MKNDVVYWIWYANVKGIGSKVKIKLLEGFESPKEIFATQGRCLAKTNISKSIIDKIAQCATRENLLKYNSVVEKHEDIGITTYFDYDYPKLLCEIADPPLVLYYKGDISLLNRRCIAIVGTRDATEKGKYHARSFARELAEQGYVVVSGMAAGIDACAHIGALSTGATCAVLAGGVDVIYPRENRDLYDKICRYGVVLSEYMPGTRPDRWRFPVRNRLMSGVCESVLLIEAPQKSGSMITVDHALEQNRDVYVLEDKTDSPEFAGNRALIDDGAKAVTNPYDIINNADFTVYDSLEHNSLMRAAEVDLHEEDIDRKDYSSLGDDELTVLKLIKSGIVQFDEIVMNCGMDVSDVGFALTMLEFKGFVTQKVGKVYEET